MKKFWIMTCLLALAGMSVFVSAEDLNLTQEIEKAQTEAKNLGRIAETRFQSDSPKDWVNGMQRESLSAIQKIEAKERQSLRSSALISSTNRVYNAWERLDQQAMENAKEFADGPSGCVLVQNGEVILTAKDLDAPSRGEIGFTFVRTYSSHWNYDGPLGYGWDHNHNVRIISNEDNTELRLLDGVREHIFHKNGEVWEPEKGTFLKLQFNPEKKQLFILDESGTKYDFEPYKNNWRIQKITSRIGNGKNSLTYRYDSSSGQLQSVTDPFGNVFRFSYNEKGRLQWVQGNQQFVQYEYNFDGCLTSAKIPSVAIDLTRAVDSLEQYRWMKNGKHFLIQEVSSKSGKKLIRFDYSDNKVMKAGAYSLTDSAKSEWTFSYTENQTRIQSPAPVPEKIFTFDSSRQDISLPVSQEIPVQKAVWNYVFNEDGLQTEVKTPDGQITKIEYNPEKANPTLRGLVVCEKKLGNDSANGELTEIGTRTKYVPETAFASEISYYQIGRDGKETQLGTKTYTYTEDFLVKEAISFTIPTRYWYNSLGELAVKQNADGACTLYFYGTKYSQNEDSFRFSEGSVNGTGLLVQKIEDAGEKDVRKVTRELGINLKTNVNTVGQVTQNLYTSRGELLGQKVDKVVEYSYRNRLGDTLLHFDSQSGLTISQFNEQFEKIAILHPLANSLATWGERLNGFTERFFRETYVYNSLGQVVEYYPTNETFGDKKETPCWKYERLPSGKILVMTNPLGIRRVTSYDEAGRVSGVHLENGDQKTVLSSEYQYSPEGRVLSYRNNQGELLRSEYSALGTEWKTIDPNGLETIKEENGLAQNVSETTFFEGMVLAKTQTFYGLNSLPVKQVKLQKYESEEAREIVTEEIHYDVCGRVNNSRETRNDSWTTFYYDGLGRKIAQIDPNGGISITCFQDGNPIYQKQIIRNELTQNYVSVGAISLYNNANQVWLQVPVDSSGSLVADRATVSHTDLMGNTVFQKTVGISETRTVWNSLGKKVSQTITPISRNFGEKDTLKTYTYDLAENLVSQSTQNDALAIWGTKTSPKPEFVSAPQTLRYTFDLLGRQTEEIQPDGLKVQKKFDASSLTSEIQWFSRDGKQLRALRFTYDCMQRPVQIEDILANKTVRTLKYDVQGNLVRSTDSVGKHEITVERTYDSLGIQRSEVVFCDGKAFPKKENSVDLPLGVNSLRWDGTDAISPFWTNMTLVSGEDGNIREMTLNQRQFCSWKYCGDQFVERNIPDSRLKQTRQFNSLNELTEIQIDSNATDHKPSIRLNYSYGKRGDVESVSSQIELADGRKKSYTHFYQNDSYQKLVSENSDEFISADVSTRRNEIFSGSSEVTSHFTSQMRFDQAGKVWTRFQGMKELVPVQPGAIPADHNPSYYSPAYLGAKVSPLSEAKLAELASNRCTTIAQTNNSGKLEAKEYRYDDLGCLTEYDGKYTNQDGEEMVVRWHLQYDVFGRLSSMKANKLKDDSEQESVAELDFAYDSFNRRLLKEVKESNKTESSITATLYERNHPCIILEQKSDKRWKVLEQYLWGVDSREILMAVLPENRAESTSSTTPRRYFLHQDQGFNVIASTAIIGSKIPLISSSCYLAFGENSTTADVAAISSSGKIENAEACFDKHLDKSDDTLISSDSSDFQFIELKLKRAADLQALRIFSNGQFPSRFWVFRIPGEEKSPSPDGFKNWFENTARDAWCLSAIDQKRPVSLTQPYVIPLKGLRSDRIVIVWNKNDAPSQVSVREFQIQIQPGTPGAIAFAGQWLDRETGLYYQLNRYRLPELNGTFISPDPLGFADGINFYAYAHNNPLSWHDPDGEFAHILFGGLIGGILGGSMYALECWITGEQFSWKKFGVATAAGAASGAVAAATFGLAAPALVSTWGGTVLASAAAWGAGGAVHGLINSTGMAKLEGYSWSESLQMGARSGLEEGLMGVVAGGITGGLTSVLPLSMGGLGRSAVSGTVGGAVSGSLYGGYAGYKQTGTLEGTLEGAKRGAVFGSVVGGTLSTVSWGVGKMSGKRGWIALEKQPDGIPDPRQKAGTMVRQGDRPTNLSYGNLPTKIGHARHHIKPVSLGGLDTADNIEYVPLEIHRQPHPGNNIKFAPEGTIVF